MTHTTHHNDTIKTEQAPKPEGWFRSPRETAEQYNEMLHTGWYAWELQEGDELPELTPLQVIALKLKAYREGKGGRA